MTDTIDNEMEQVNIAFDKLEAAENNPLQIIKAALSRLPALLLISSGMFINWVLAIVFLVQSISVLPFTTILIGLLFLAVLFPLGYCYAAYTYGQQVLLFQVYQELVRPVLGNLIGKVLNKILKDDTIPTTSENIQQEVQKEAGSFLDKIPAFIKNRLAIFTVINDVIQLATERYKNDPDNSSKEAAKNNIINYVFELLDARMQTIANPSLQTFLIIGGINIVALFFIF